MRGVAADGHAWLREWVTTLIALAISVFALSTLWDVYAVAKPLTDEQLADPMVVKHHGEAFERRKDVLLFSLSLFGTVVGYYFGRVPTEVRAERLEGNLASLSADAARLHRRAEDESAARQEADNKIKHTIGVLDGIGIDLDAFSRVEGGFSEDIQREWVAETLRRIRDELDALRQSLQA